MVYENIFIYQEKPVILYWITQQTIIIPTGMQLTVGVAVYIAGFLNKYLDICTGVPGNGHI